MDNASDEKKRDEIQKFVKAHKVPDFRRSHFHFIPPTGWMNDPNGFSKYNGKYHLFYQYYPFESVWGLMHWGHAVTEDLIHWEDLEVALIPGDDFDKNGAYSGTALCMDGMHVLMYTGHICDEQKNTYYQVQNIAAGDGKIYEKYERNPVITGEMLPDGCSKKDFRDPKIWQEDKKFYALLANAAENKGGQLVLFSSDDLKVWNSLGVVKNNFSIPDCKMWECPDYINVGKKDILIFSLSEVEAGGEKYVNHYGAVYQIGIFDKEKSCFYAEYSDQLDYGLDFYAPQFLGQYGERVILIAWMQTWKRNIPLAKEGVAGMMTLPREIILKDGQILQKPIREMERIRKEKVHKKFILQNRYRVGKINGKCAEFVLFVKMKRGDKLNIYLMASDDCKTYCSFFYDADKEELEFDRECIGSGIEGINKRKVKMPLKNGMLHMDIFLELYSV